MTTGGEEKKDLNIGFLKHGVVVNIRRSVVIYIYIYKERHNVITIYTRFFFNYFIFELKNPKGENRSCSKRETETSWGQSGLPPRSNGSSSW